jgi:hypothetical protein
MICRWRCHVLPEPLPGVIAAMVCAAGWTLSASTPDLDRQLTGHMRQVRPIGADAHLLLQNARARSATVRSLLDRLNGSDVIVYLQRGVFDRPEVKGRTSLITAVPDARFLRVMIRSALTNDSAVEILGHELQHVQEIAQEPRIRSEDTLRKYLNVIGFECGAGRFETDAAIEVERQIRTEVALMPKPTPRVKRH